MEIKAFKWLESKAKNFINLEIINNVESLNDENDLKPPSAKLRKGECIDPFVAAIVSVLTWWVLEEI